MGSKSRRREWLAAPHIQQCGHVLRYSRRLLQIRPRLERDCLPTADREDYLLRQSLSSLRILKSVVLPTVEL